MVDTSYSFQSHYTGRTSLRSNYPTWGAISVWGLGPHFGALSKMRNFGVLVFLPFRQSKWEPNYSCNTLLSWASFNIIKMLIYRSILKRTLPQWLTNQLSTTKQDTQDQPLRGRLEEFVTFSTVLLVAVLLMDLYFIRTPSIPSAVLSVVL